MRFTYLFINFFTILVPFAFSFERKINFRSKWKYFFPANFISAFLFLVWDFIAVQNGVWSFNDKYITGVKLFTLPLEEILFFFTVPYSCIFIYESVTFYRSNPAPSSFIRCILWGLGIMFALVSFFAIHKAYTGPVLLIASILLLLFAFFSTAQEAENFSIAFAISLLPMLAVNGLLTALPVVIYNNAENTGVRLGTIPIEDFVYALALLLLNTGLLNRIKKYSAG